MKYEITITQKEVYTFENIEAENEEDAKNKVLEIFDSDKKQEYYYDSDADIEIYEVRE